MQHSKVRIPVVSLSLIFFIGFNISLFAQDNNSRTFIQIRVDGLSCPFCAYGLEKKIKKVEGAANIEIDLEEGIVSLDVPSNKKPTEKSLKKVVTDAGFTPREIRFSETPFKKNNEGN